MTTYTKETALYDTGAIGDGINGAAQTASSYLTDVTNDGVFVHEQNANPVTPSTSGANGVHISDDVDIIRNGEVVASYGSTTVIGKPYVSGATDNGSHMIFDYRSMKMLDKEGDEYLHISELRDRDGNIIEEFQGDGTTTEFEVLYSVSSVSEVLIDGVATTDYSQNPNKTIQFIFTNPPSDGSIITIKYVSTSGDLAKQYTFGSRVGATGLFSYAEGFEVTASGSFSHAEGYQTVASSLEAHAEGFKTEATDYYSHAEGAYTHARDIASHAEGWGCYATATYAHAEGSQTHATNDGAHSEGLQTHADGDDSHAEGFATYATGDYSHAQNHHTKASKRAQTAIGTYNKEDTSSTTTHPTNNSDYGKYAFIIGNGTGEGPDRSNALTVDWAGNIESGKNGTHTVSSSDISDTGHSGTMTGKFSTAVDSTAVYMNGMVQLTIYVQNTQATANAGNVFRHYLSLPDKFMPKYTVTGGSYYSKYAMMAKFNSEGELVVRNANHESFSQLTGTDNIVISLLYISKTA